MPDSITGTAEQVDVAIIGGGPAGLAAAMELKRRGVSRVAVLEREDEAGGIPRHCGHPPFGMREFGRILTGPQYAAKLVRGAIGAGVELRVSTSVVRAEAGGRLTVATGGGTGLINARRVVLATGVREMTRPARLISGTRPLGVLNTGALQSMVYLKKLKPFERPVIVGSELVSFSAIQTCRHAKIRPVAMIEAADNAVARWPVPLFARLAGVPLHLGSRLVGIRGEGRVSAVEIENPAGDRRVITCDGVILTGRFTPEAALVRCGHLAIDTATNGPLVDQFGRCSDPAYFAAGNILRPVESAGWSWNEGRQSGGWVADDLAGNLPAAGGALQISTADPLIRFVMPQKITMPHTQISGISGMKNLQLRFSRRARGNLLARNNNNTIFRRGLEVYPERRVLIPLKKLLAGNRKGRIELEFEQTGSR